MRSKITLAHHWMEYFRGGEAVLDQIAQLFPDAPIAVLVYHVEHLPPTLLSHKFLASFLQRLPYLRTHFRNLLPVFPEIIRTIRLPPETRLVLSSDASMIKGIPLPDGAVHVCYCHSPPRYLWGLEDSYIESMSQRNRIGRRLFSASIPRLRAFDLRMAQRVDHFIANSQCVQQRISRYYGRESVVIYPPIDVNKFNYSRPREDFYLVVSALVPYKRVDLAVDACVRLGRRLVVIGTGPEENDLARRGAPNVTFMGWQPSEVLRDHYERCRAFLFPGIEDFGITPCEAQASGAPVIAFGLGGALETVREGHTGLFFATQTVEALADAIVRFEAMPGFPAEACRANVAHLGPERFRREIRQFLDGEYPELFLKHPWPEDGVNTPSGTTRTLPTAKIDTPASGNGSQNPFTLGIRPLRILLVVEPGLDGVFRHVEGLVDFLLRQDVRIHLAYSTRRCGAGMLQLVERIRKAGGEVVDMRVTNIPEIRDGPALAKLLRLIGRIRPDVVHAHSSKAGALARFAAILGRRGRFIYTPHAYYGMAKPPSIKVLFFSQVERALGHIGRTVAISQDEATFARDKLGISRERISVVHNPVDTIRFAPASAEQRRTARAQFGIPEKAVVIATIGRMCWQKDPDTAYSGVAPVCLDNPDMLFLHLGWGKWKQYLLEKARKLGIGPQLRILDYTEDPRAFFHAIDGLVVSSRYEAGWPLVFLEAMACNLPVVASTCMGMSDIGKAGLSHVWTYEPEEAEGCTRSVRQWLASQREGARPCNHRTFATERLSPERCYGALFDLYLNRTSQVVSPLA